MKPKYWAIIILTITAGIICWYYYLISQSKLRSQCVTPALLEEIKKYPKPDSKGCPKGYFVQGLLCPGSPIWCEPDNNINVSTSTPSSMTEVKDWKTYVNNEYGFELEYPGDWITYDDIYYKDSRNPMYLFQWGIEPPTRPSDYKRYPYYSVSVINNPKMLNTKEFFIQEKNKYKGEAPQYLPFVNVQKSESLETLSGSADVFIIPGVISVRRAYLASGNFIFEIDKPEDLSYTEVYTKEELLNIFNHMLSSLKLKATVTN